MADAPHLRSISPDATPEEVAAVLAAVASIEAHRRAAVAAAAAASGGDDPQRLDAWVRASRMVHRRSGMAKGPWRLSGRLPRRSRV
ncbi:MAG TPA: hypothetical protein VM618_07480 [Acidimicrobiia bacterium]|nr:hypothetical protein [Acidimicrobiia bacterium]